MKLVKVLVSVALPGLLHAAGCASGVPGGVPSGVPGGGPQQGHGPDGGIPAEPFTFGWIDRHPEPVEPGHARVAHMSVGPYVYDVHYGAEQADDEEAAPVLTDRGLTWRQFSGYFFIWGHWVMFETERTRTITWGTESAARMLPPDATYPAREQIIVRCGEVVIMPRVPDDSAFKSIKVQAGADGSTPVYVVVSTSMDGQGNEVVEISEVKRVPVSESEADPDGVRDLYKSMVAAHPSTCY